MVVVCFLVVLLLPHFPSPHLASFAFVSDTFAVESVLLPHFASFDFASDALFPHFASEVLLPHLASAVFASEDSVLLPHFNSKLRLVEDSRSDDLNSAPEPRLLKPKRFSAFVVVAAPNPSTLPATNEPVKKICLAS